MRDISFTKQSEKLSLGEIEEIVREKKRRSGHILDISKTPRHLSAPHSTLAKNTVTDIISPRGFFPKTRQKINYLKKEFSAHHLRFLKNVHFFLLAMALVGLFNLINVYYQGLQLKNDVLESALLAAASIKEIPKNPSDLKQIKEIFYQALTKFSPAENRIWFLSQNPTISQKKDENLLISAHAAVQGGRHLLSAGLKFSEGVSEIETLLPGIIGNSAGQKKNSLTEKLKINLTAISAGFHEINAAKQQLKIANPQLLPEKYRSQFIFAREEVSKIANFFQHVESHFPALLNLLGDRYPRSYLVLFPNNNERRPIMGFPGSGMHLEINDGHITKSDVFDIYEVDGQIVEKIALPKVFESITGNWGVRDSNSSADGAVSARQAMYLYEKAGRPGVDGVIYIDLEVLKKMLEITGPIRLAGFDAEITSENFDQLLSYIVESKMDGVTDPKKVIKNLVPEMLSRLSQKEKMLDFARALPQLMSQKHLIAYAKIAEIQELFKFLGVDGVMNPPAENEDYLSLIETSISGNKSDKYIQEKIDLQTSIKENGIIENRLTITRRHTFGADDEEMLLNLGNNFGLPPLDPELKRILGAGKNITSLRVYVPKGSRLKQVIGLDPEKVESLFDQDINLSYFQTFAEIEAGQEKSFTFVYELPYQLKFNRLSPLHNYIFTLQKQSGAPSTPFHQEIIYNSDLKIYKTLPENIDLKLEKGKITFQTDLNTDQKIGFVMGK